MLAVPCSCQIQKTVSGFVLFLVAFNPLRIRSLFLIELALCALVNCHHLVHILVVNYPAQGSSTNACE
jgi:hypothetical protein